MNTENDDTFMFATQTHVMSDDLLNALDLMIDLSPGSNDEMCEWCLNLLKTVDVGEEFTVTAAQAQWLIANSQKTYESLELEESEQADTEDLDLIFETFDDYTNFVRHSQNDSPDSDIFRIIGELKGK
jgi:hypothetical protein